MVKKENNYLLCLNPKNTYILRNIPPTVFIIWSISSESKLPSAKASSI